jgi:hypothetical protein
MLYPNVLELMHVSFECICEQMVFTSHLYGSIYPMLWNLVIILPILMQNVFTYSTTCMRYLQGGNHPINLTQWKCIKCHNHKTLLH